MNRKPPSMTPLLLLAGLCIHLAGGADPLAAQHSTGGGAALRAGHYLDYFVHWQREAENGGEAANGVGGRIMWQLPGAAPHVPIPRAALGAFLIRIPSDGEREDVWHFGAQADLPLVRRPLAERVEPVVSLGVGAIRTPVQSDGSAGTGGPRPVEARPAAEHGLTVTPGIGARIRVVPGLHLRSDIRQVLPVREGAQRFLEASGGVSLQV